MVEEVDWMKKNWFERHADRRNPQAFILTDPVYFAQECAAAILNGGLSVVQKEEPKDGNQTMGQVPEPVR